MKRRRALAALGALAAGLAGCTDDARDGPTPDTGAPTGPSQPTDGGGDDGAVTAYQPLEATDFRVFESGGRLGVELTVENPAGLTRESVVVVSTAVDGEAVSGRTAFTIESGETETVTVTVPVDYDEWDGGLDFTFEPQD